MIFLTLGTHEQPFERALDLVLPLAGAEEVVVQHGETPPRPAVKNVRWLRYTDYEAVTALMTRASVVIAHAGVGSIITALHAGRTPVVLARLPEHGEHVDDHQRQIAGSFAERGFVVPHEPGDDLTATIAAATSAAVARDSAGADLRRAVGRAARGLSIA